MKRNFKKIFKGLAPLKNENGEIVYQSIYNMDIVFLTLKEDSHSRNEFADPVLEMDKLKASNSTYGELYLRNGSNKPYLAPPQIAVLNSKQAQNHAMTKGAIIEKNSVTHFQDAGCVQGSQTGMIRENHDNQYRLLPFGVREYLVDKVGDTSGFENVYDSIYKVGEQTGSYSGKYIDKYYSKFDRKLHEFISHFEYVEKSIGFIVLIDDEIVGIDKFPSYEYAKSIFKMMVRDVYGSLAIISEKNKEESKKRFTQNLKKRGRGSVVSKLRKALRKTKRQKTDLIVDRITELMDYTFDLKKDSDTSGAYSSHILKSDDEQSAYVGQVLSATRTEFHYLISIVKKSSFKPKNFRVASEMRKMSREQNDFAL